ncbi:MAG: AraC family transcriptional regulator [Clostridiales bacterium]|nr:AraC family transcriptional regulator [Clostridiales bacterium]
MGYETLKAAAFMQTDDEISLLKTVTEGHCGLHAHDFIEFAYVVSGKGHHIVGGQRDFIQKGDFFIFNESVLHEYRAEGGAPIVMYNLIFKPFAIDQSIRSGGDFLDVAYRYLFHSFYKDENPRAFLKFTGVKSHPVRTLLEDMYAEYCRKGKGYKQILKSDLVKLLILSFRLYQEDDSQSQDAPVLRNLVVQNALSFMRAGFDNPITCEQLAERSYVSVSYFNKIFKEETGTTPLRMLQNIRMEAAAELLRTTALPAIQIAMNVGYADTKFFYKIFKQYTGLTPGDYRRQYKTE